MTWQYIAIRASSKVKRVDRTKCRWECGTTVILMHCWWECKMLQPLLKKKKKDEQFLKKKQYVYIIEANHSSLKSALKRNNYHPNKDLCTKFLKIGQKQISLKRWSEVAQSCLTLCDPMGYSLPGSSIHGIFQARVLECVAMSFSTQKMNG